VAELTTSREKLQNCPKVQNGEFDLDSLCTELQKKAKCSGKGPLVQEQEFKSILKKYLGKELAEGCKDSFSS
jgi:AP-1-like transcription factor